MSTNRESPGVAGGTSGRVVVGVHGSPSSLIALRHAVGIAVDRGWDLEIVTAWPDADDPLIHDVPGRYIVARGRADQCQHRALASLDTTVASTVDTFLVNARPAEALMSRCREIDLLVVGAGRSQRQRGSRSVAAECAEAGPCHVTVAPHSRAEQLHSEPPPPLRRRPAAPQVGRAQSA